MTVRVAVALGGDSAVTDGCYLQALRDAGMEPERLYPQSSAEEIRATMHAVSGLVLSGGADIHPSRYGEEPAGSEMRFVSEARDAMEFAALAEADRLGLPILAICRGMQMLNVYRGGALLQDIGGTHRDGRKQDEKWRAFHEVEVDAGTKLAAALASPAPRVNSRHHQAVDPDRVGAGLRIIGWCPADRIVEAVEEPGERFVVGVQWHPENMAIGPAGTPEREQASGIFAAFAVAVEAFASAGAARP